MLAVAFLAGPILFYVLPAVVPIWKPFLIIWAGLGLLLILSWIVPTLGHPPQDELARMIDGALRFVLGMCWIMAGLVQAIRGVARARSLDGYAHWPAVGLVGMATLAVGLLFL